MQFLMFCGNFTTCWWQLYYTSRLAFSSTKRQVLDVVKRTGLAAELGEAKIFASDDVALAALSKESGANPGPKTLKPPSTHLAD